MYSRADMSALQRYWIKKRETAPAATRADWSRVMARRNKIIGPWAISARLRVLQTKGVFGGDLCRWSWLAKRAYFLARQEHRAEKNQYSKLRQRHVRRKNKPVH